MESDEINLGVDELSADMVVSHHINLLSILL